MTTLLTKEEEVKRAELQAEIDRLDKAIETALKQIIDNLNVALTRRCNGGTNEQKPR